MMGIIRDARIADERVIAPAPPAPAGPGDDPAAVIEQARRDAEAAGYAAGEAAARAEYAPELSRALAALEAAAGALEDHARQVTAQAVREAAELAVVIAGQLVDGALDADPDQIQAMIASALRAAGDTPVRILVNPDDMQVAAAVTGSWAGVAPVIATSPDVTRGGCVIETASGDLDARIATRLGVMRAVLADNAPSH